MIGQKRMLMGVLGALLLAGCDGRQTKISQADQTELTQLREEKKTWASEKTKMEAKVDWWGKLKNDAQSELKKVKDELKACQDKQTSTSDARLEGKEKK